MKSIYIIRHGQTEYNRRGVLQGRAIDAPLNETGLAQAAAFHNFYREEDFQLVITSDLIRSIQSVEGFLENGNIHQIDKRITEFSWGANEGMPLSEIVVDNYQKMLKEWNKGNLDARIPEGESGRELRDRVHSFVDEIRQREEDKILICTHGRTLKMLIVEMLQKKIAQMDEVRHSNMALFLMKYDEGNFHLQLENDTRHLPGDLNQNAYWDGK